MKTKQSAKIISLLLVLCMSFGIFGISTSASSAKSATSKAVSCYNAAYKKTVARDFFKLKYKSVSAYKYDYSQLKPLDKFLTMRDNESDESILRIKGISVGTDGEDNDVLSMNFFFRKGKSVSTGDMFSDFFSMSVLDNIKESEFSSDEDIIGKTGTVTTDKNGDKIVTFKFKIKAYDDPDYYELKESSATAKISKDGYFKKLTFKTTTNYNSESRFNNYYLKEERKTETYEFIYAKVRPTSISFNTKEITLKPDDFYQLEVTVKPDNATVKDIYWTSSDNYVAAVSGDNKIYAKDEGTTTLKAYTYDGNLVATCKVTVRSTNGKHSVATYVKAIEDIVNSIYQLFFDGELL